MRLFFLPFYGPELGCIVIGATVGPCRSWGHYYRAWFGQSLLISTMLVALTKLILVICRSSKIEAWFEIELSRILSSMFCRAFFLFATRTYSGETPLHFSYLEY